MIYKIYKTSEVIQINKCLEENKLLIGKDSIIFPEAGKIAFLLMDNFDAETVGNALCEQKWRKQYEETMNELADNIEKIEWMKLYKPDEKVGERPTGGKIGNMEGVISISAEDGIKSLNDRNKTLFNTKKTLEKLLERSLSIKKYE